MEGHSSRRIPELDGLRGIACLMVLVWHYLGIVDRRWGPLALLCEMVGIPTETVAAGGPSTSGTMSALAVLAPSGVDLFFVLSGFLISGILFDNSDSPSYFRTFYIRRVCRIFPVYYVVFGSLLLAIPLASMIPAMQVWLVRDLMPLWSYATFTQNFFMALDATTNGGGRWIAMTWSVAVEEHFYLVFPFIVRFVSRATVRDLAIVSILGAAVLRVAAKNAGIWYYPLLPCRLDCMAVGVLLAYAIREPGVWDWIRAHRGHVYLGMVLTLIGFAFFHDHMLGYTWIALLFGCVLMLIVVHPETALAGVCRWPSLQKVGLISYGVYMYHQAVNGMLHALFFQAEPAVRDAGTLAVTLLAFPVTFALSAASYHFMEKHFLRLGYKASWKPAMPTPEVTSYSKAA